MFHYCDQCQDLNVALHKVCVVQIIQPEQEWLACKNKKSSTQKTKKNTQKREVHVRVHLFSMYKKDWKKSKHCQKSPKNTKRKNTHTGPTNSMEKSFSNRSEFTLAVGKGLVA